MSTARVDEEETARALRQNLTKEMARLEVPEERLLDLTSDARSPRAPS